jgi:hypothetical protein
MAIAQHPITAVQASKSRRVCSITVSVQVDIVILSCAVVHANTITKAAERGCVAVLLVQASDSIKHLLQITVERA